MLSPQFNHQPKPNMPSQMIERPGMGKAPKKSWKISSAIWWGILIIIAVILAWKFAPAKTDNNFGLSLNVDNYQAVFLTNGQVYFGQINSINDNYVKLSNIYYLRLREALQSQGKLPADGYNADQSRANFNH
ncbi:MAG: hypothetical protein UV05_C0006G0014 [candidate division CPR1 bacterium GW2011_GWA2_42_17]|uniref:Uncharacterized protein n=1 Tax=candidate division CPR1 bacterium GW2011_GWA2_42_17 TaxID=1618341 RepID=A0A0G0Z6Z1_9BACT|nr:MAG: hypothetical protein UV05_C0006G0014 [candidate division CPR1 bacterium GW2011_GWA2_42_17]